MRSALFPPSTNKLLTIVEWPLKSLPLDLVTLGWLRRTWHRELARHVNTLQSFHVLLFSPRRLPAGMGHQTEMDGRIRGAQRGGTRSGYRLSRQGGVVFRGKDIKQVTGNKRHKQVQQNGGWLKWHARCSWNRTTHTHKHPKLHNQQHRNKLLSQV